MPVDLDGPVVQRFAAGNEAARNFRVPVAGLDGGARAEPVRRPALEAHPLPANPIADQDVIVGEQVVIEVVAVDIPAVNASSSGRIGIDGLEPKIGLWQMRQAR